MKQEAIPMEKLKLGLFGARRGGSYLDIFAKDEENIEIVAVCDKDYEELGAFKKHPDYKYFKDFDEFLAFGKENGMTAVFLANFFNQHTPYAIRCMEAGMDVISECTAAATLKECVELVECVERTGKKYMLAENYPFSAPNLEMNRIVRSGQLGSVLYAEGEYNHSGPRPDMLTLGSLETDHWRAYMPRTYYCTHAFGPLMYMTDSVPRYVSARSVHSDLLYTNKDVRLNYDGTGIGFCEMSNGMIARFTGCTAMASDYSRYRIVGDKCSVEIGGNIGDNKVRKMWLGHTKPEDEPASTVYTVSQDDFGEMGKKAKGAGHSGGDGWVAQIMLKSSVKA